MLGDLREAMFDFQKRPLIKAHAILGLDRDLMIKATLVGAEDDAVNIFNWLANFTPYAELAEAYAKSPRLPIQDILVIGDNLWANADPYYHNHGGPQLALVDESANVIFNLGMGPLGAAARRAPWAMPPDSVSMRAKTSAPWARPGP